MILDNILDKNWYFGVLGNLITKLILYIADSGFDKKAEMLFHIYIYIYIYIYMELSSERSFKMRW
jgi:hypothetical protein